MKTLSLVANILLVILGISIKFGCLAMPDPEVNINVNFNVGEQGGNTNGQDKSSDDNGNIITCDDPWVFLDGAGCFRAIYDMGNTWDSAQSKCTDQGGHLAILNTEVKRLAIAKYIEDVDMAGVWWWWIGANGKTGQWTWVNGQPLTDGWSSGQPNSATGDGTCASLYFPTKHNSKFWDNSCSWTGINAYICQKTK